MPRRDGASSGNEPHGGTPCDPTVLTRRVPARFQYGLGLRVASRTSDSFG
ncbi:hypothetical protein RHECNPAF_4310065 [Rhizobium etli CNPAF512]|nr:hypothetical protein RHECNPAF_4310065 [Rhizobium etli CNPAF512]